MSWKLHSWRIAVAGCVLWALPCTAQLMLGDNLQLKGNGSVSTGYAGSLSDNGNSGHSLNFGGNGNFNGFYHDPGFVSFSLVPYYNQSRDNSSSQSIFDSSGITFNANILKDTHFPGGISYGKGYNSTGTFGNSALSNFTTHGNHQSMGIGWSALLPGLPPVTATYSIGTGGSTLYGTNAASSGTTRTYGIRSSYPLLGFHLNANYTHSASETTTPELLSSQKELRSNSASTSYGLSASHPFPLRGSISASANRVSYTGAYSGGATSSTTDYENASIVFRPTKKMSVSLNQNYSDNLSGQINQAIIAAGGVPQTSSGSGTHNLNLSGGVSYAIVRGLGASGVVTHIDQYYGKADYQATYVSGSLNGGYGRSLFGVMTWSVSAVDNANQDGNSSVGMLANADISRRVKGWNLSGSFNYAQNVQTVLVLYTDSYYRYGVQVSRRLGKRKTWSGQFSESHSIGSGQGSAVSSGENVSSSLSVYWLTATGNYSKTNGTSIQTIDGLQPSPLPLQLLPSTQVVAYGGSNYGFSLVGTPVHKLSIVGTYTKALSNTLQSTINSLNQSESFGSSVAYQMRKISLRAGFSKLAQSVSATGTRPNGLTTYYFGVYRSFNLF